MKQLLNQLQLGMRRLLARPKAQSKVLEHQNNISNTPPLSLEDDIPETGSIVSDEDEPKEEAPKVVRKVVKKVNKKPQHKLK